MKGMLAYLINEVIEINYVHVLKNLEFRNTELLNEKALEKRKTSDLIVDIDKMTVNLEMNAIAKNMLNEGEPIDKISKYTGLTEEEIEKLKEN